MVWNSVLKVKLGNKIIYEKNLYMKDICIQNNKSEFNAENNHKCETLSMEVFENARKR